MINRNDAQKRQLQHREIFSEDLHCHSFLQSNIMCLLWAGVKTKKHPDWIQGRQDSRKMCACGCKKQWCLDTVIGISIWPDASIFYKASYLYKMLRYRFQYQYWNWDTGINTWLNGLLFTFHVGNLSVPFFKKYKLKENRICCFYLFKSIYHVSN